MAKIKAQSANLLHSSTSKKRPGIHAKKKMSNLKTSKLYKKRYKGQG